MTKISKYRLNRPFWDGTRMHSRGSILPFPEGAAPKSAIELSAYEAKERAKERKEAIAAKKKAEAALAAAEKKLKE